MTADFKLVDAAITKYGLKPTSQRDLPLLSFTAIARGYTHGLRKVLGLSYRAVGSLGGGGKFHSLLNEAGIAADFHDFVEKNFAELEQQTFVPAQKIKQAISAKLSELEKGLAVRPEKALRTLAEIYPDYIAGIGIYNCYWRYLGNDPLKGKLTAEIVDRVSRERDLMARIYPEIEKLLGQIVSLIGGKNGYDGDLLRYLTMEELLGLEDFSLLPAKLEELTRRRRKHVYLYIEDGGQEYLLTDPADVEAIENKHFRVGAEGLRELKGYPAFGGRVKGRVHNVQTTSPATFADGLILVAGMTHPDDVALIKKAAAIVTDEGGILSHAVVISRELKKPCIVGTKIATKILQTGDWVEVDADKGVVTLHPSLTRGR